MISVLAFFLLQMACPEHHDHAMATRGDAVMGFSHEATKHTFLLFADGGAIEVRALDAKDTATVKAIRQHLRSIAGAFAGGDFGRPEAIHDRQPDGASAMKELRRTIAYNYSDLDGGGRVGIRTENQAAIDAVHHFLRFQITEHATGDSTEVRPE